MDKTLRVLIIEDDEGDALLLVRHLQKEYPVVKHERVVDYEQMKAALEKHSWDVVICDYRLPRFDAHTALRLIEETGLDLPFLMVSGTIGEETAVELMKSGVHDCIMKDNLFRLVPAVKREIQDALVRSERRKAIQDLRLAKERAEEGDRLKTAFLANMSHEIRTPMNSILGFSELLDDETLSPYDRKEFIRVILYNGRHLLDIINNLVDIARIDSGQIVMSKHIFNLNHLLDKLFLSAENSRRQKSKEKIEIFLQKGLPDENSYILADEENLRKILTNILDNSLKFTVSGEIRFGYEPVGDKLKFFVRDTGRGISREKQAVIFEKFRQEEETFTRQFGGSGLGLSISKGLIELMGGEIWLESVQGRGSVFYFTIPYSAPGEMVKIKASAGQKSEHNFNGRSILVVDDVDANIDLVQLSFVKTGATLFVAANGREAVDTIRNHPEIGLVLMDMQMPVMNGFEATSELLKINPDIPVIAITAYVSTDDKQRCYEVGCIDFLTKPFSKADICGIAGKYLK